MITPLGLGSKCHSDYLYLNNRFVGLVKNLKRTINIVYDSRWQVYDSRSVCSRRDLKTKNTF